MSHIDSSRVARRGFLARLSAAAAGLTALAATRSPLQAESLTTSTNPNDPDAWIDRLTGKDRVLFHTHKALMPGLGAARNVLTNGKEAYGIPEATNSVAVAVHGAAIGGLLRDEIWQRYKLGELYKINDGMTGAPATRNVFLTSQDGVPPDVTVPDLMNRGVIFVVCNVAVRNLAKRLVSDGQEPAELHSELLGGLLPGAIVVPDLFVAMSHAQKKGISYIFAD